MVEFFRGTWRGAITLWLGTGTMIFGIAVAVGFVCTFILPDAEATIREYLGSAPPFQPSWSEAFGLFRHNLMLCFCSFLAGAALGGLMAFFDYVLIGAILGLAAGTYFRYDQTATFLAGTAVHGIFEIPAFLLSQAWGLKTGVEWLAKSSEGRRKVIWLENFRCGLRAHVLVAIFMLIAAVVETFISPFVLAMVQAMDR